MDRFCVFEGKNADFEHKGGANRVNLFNRGINL